MRKSRNMDTAVMCSKLQLVSTERNAGDDISPSGEDASKQPPGAGGKQAYLAAMNVHTTK